VTHCNPTTKPRYGCIGLPMPDTMCRVVDLDRGVEDVAPGQPGELLVSSSSGEQLDAIGASTVTPISAIRGWAGSVVVAGPLAVSHVAGAEEPRPVRASNSS